MMKSAFQVWDEPLTYAFSFCGKGTNLVNTDSFISDIGSVGISNSYLILDIRTCISSETMQNIYYQLIPRQLYIVLKTNAITILY